MRMDDLDETAARRALAETNARYAPSEPRYGVFISELVFVVIVALGAMLGGL